MPDIGYLDRPAALAASRRTSPPMRRALLLLVVAGAAAAGGLASGADATALAVAQAGPDLSRLLRAMAGLKALAAIGLLAVAYWRLGTPIGNGRLAAYAIGCASMAAGPGLIWGMTHVGAGALLLHGGLAAMVILLWLDPEIGRRLELEIARRRARLRA